MKLRLYTFKPDSTEKVTEWSFEPLRKTLGFVVPREDTTDATGILARRPFSEQLYYNITFAARTLARPENFKNFRRMLRSHKIEILMKRGGKEAWIEFKLDEQEDVQFEVVEDVDQLRRKTVKFVQAVPLAFTDFENTKLEIAE
jgi:hypothetical protein